jgi:putative transposase
VVDAHRDEFGVEPICRVLDLAPSSYYAVKTRQRDPSARALRDRELLDLIRKLHAEKLRCLRRPEGVVAAAPRRRRGRPLHR